MMVRELLMQILLIKTVLSKSAYMHIFILFTKMLQGRDTASGTVLHKKC